MEPSISDIPPLRHLGVLPGLPDWMIARRTWTTSEGKQYQFVISHPHNWSYEYRCTDQHACLGHYWCTCPQSQILQAVVEYTTLSLMFDHWDWMTSDGI